MLKWQSRAIFLPTDTFIAFCRIRVKNNLCHYTLNPLSNLKSSGCVCGGGGGVCLCVCGGGGEGVLKNKNSSSGIKA